MIQQIIEEHSNYIKEENKNKIELAVKQLNENIDKYGEFEIIENDINEKYQQAIGKIYARDTKVCSLIPDDFSSFTKYLGINLTEDSESYNISFRSLGEQSLLYLILRLVRDKSNKKQKYSLILMEEPEVHLHTHLQRTLFRNVQSQFGNQMIMSTHSQNISVASSISKMIILEKKSTETNSYYPSYKLEPEDIEKTERYLDANRTPLLFAKSVILVEGDAEAIILPWLFEKHYKTWLDEYCVSLINMNSTFFEPISKLFNRDRIRRFYNNRFR